MRGWPGGLGEAEIGGDGRQARRSSGRDKSSQPDWGWGATVEMVKKASSKAGGPDWYEVTVLVMCKPEDSANGKRQRDSPPTPMVSGIGVDCSIRSWLIPPCTVRISMLCKSSLWVISFRCCLSKLLSKSTHRTLVLTFT